MVYNGLFFCLPPAVDGLQRFRSTSLAKLRSFLFFHSPSRLRSKGAGLWLSHFHGPLALLPGRSQTDIIPKGVRGSFNAERQIPKALWLRYGFSLFRPISKGDCSFNFRRLPSITWSLSIGGCVPHGPLALLLLRMLQTDSPPRVSVVHFQGKLTE